MNGERRAPPSQAESTIPPVGATGGYDISEDRRWLGLARALVAIGITLRIVQYLANRSIYRDEAALALNLRWRSWGELLGPLDFGQTSPLGYLILLKGLVTVLGDHEFVLRFPSALAGIAALVIYLRLAQKCLAPLGVAVAAALLALSPAAVYWSADAKQYSIGLFSTVLIVALVMMDQPARNLALAGLLAWFSEAVVFVFTGTGLVLLLRRDRRAITVIPMWILLVAPPVAISLLGASGEVGEYLRDFWQDSFIQYGSMEEMVASTLVLPLLALRYPLGFGLPEMLLALLAMGWGGWKLRHNAIGPYLLVPLAVTFLAAAVGQYPFGGVAFRGRTILFLAPLCYLLLAGGVVAAVKRHATAGAIVILVLLFALTPSLGTLPYKIDDQRSLILYAIEHASPGDRVYVDYFGAHALEYYRPRWDFRGMDVIVGGCTPGTWPLSRGDLPLLEGGRVWIVESIPPHESHLSEFLAREGRKLEGRNESPGAVTLIDVPESLPPPPEWGRPDSSEYRPELDCRGLNHWPR